MLGKRALSSFVLASAFVLSCSAMRPAELPMPDADLGLGEVVMMTWTTREPDGLLGHVLEPVDGFSVDPHRKVILGEPREVSTSQTLHIVVRTGVHGKVEGGYGPVSGSAEGARTTHVAYDVRVTGYLEYPTSALRYNAKTNCCLGGQVAPECGMAYVSRMIRGTGKAQHLEELSGGASVNATSVVVAEGGAEFRQLAESEFEETFFAYELSSMETLCAHLSPDEEMEALSVEAPKNCFLTQIDDEGRRTTLSWTLPSEELCARLTRRKCALAGESLLSCDARFGVEEHSRTLSLEPPPSASNAPSLPPSPGLVHSPGER